MQLGSNIIERAELLEDTSLSMEFSWPELMDLSTYMGTMKYDSCTARQKTANSRK